MVWKTVNFFGMQKTYIICDVCNDKLFPDEDDPIYAYLLEKRESREKEERMKDEERERRKGEE